MPSAQREKARIMADKEKIGVIGTGRMGQAMVRHLIKNGYPVMAQDIEPKSISAARFSNGKCVSMRA